MSRCHKPGLNPRQASFVSGSLVVAFLSSDALDGFVRTCASIRSVLHPPDDFSAKSKVLSQTGFARFLVFRIHVFAGVGQSLDGRIKINAVPPSDLVRRDHESGPSLNRTEGAA